MCRLKRLQAENNRVKNEMNQEAGRFARLAGCPRPRIVTAFNLFQTPERVASQMAELIPTDARRILEPSAGLGRLYVAGIDAAPGAQWVLVEQSADCCQELYNMAQDAEIRQGDFLERADLGSFDCVIMNPPFKQGRDIKHIKHALTMLKPGGLLISLCYDGARQNSELKPIADTWEPLPAGTFKSEGTAAGAVLITVKP